MAFFKFSTRVFRDLNKLVNVNTHPCKNFNKLVAVKFIHYDYREKHHHNSSHRQHFNEQNFLYLGLGFVCLSVTVIGLKKCKINLLPTVHAVSPFDTADSLGGSGSRNRFNFIADVVEKTAASVVYIAIVDNRR